MNEVKVFESPEFGRIRIVEIEGTPWLVGKDVALALDYKDPSSAVSKNVDLDDKTTLLLEQDGSNYKSATTLINESGLYSLVLASKLPKAKKFKRWVTSEVLPSIRKTGGYVANDDLFIQTYLPFANENTKALFRTTLHTISEQNKLIQQQKNKIQQDKPLVEFAEHVSESVNSIDMATFAKLLYDENIKIGRNRLFAWMKKNKYLMRDTKPYQKYVDYGYFELKEQTYKTPYGEKRVGTKTLITGKGQIYFTEKLRKEFSR